MSSNCMVPSYIEDMLEQVVCDTTVLSEALLTIAQCSMNGTLEEIDPRFVPEDDPQ